MALAHARELADSLEEWDGFAVVVVTGCTKAEVAAAGGRRRALTSPTSSDALMTMPGPTASK